jgi:uncharacterized protein (DUF1015 family)
LPVVRPFRALRFSTEVVGDLSRVLSPPYDVISPEQQRELLARDPRNVVRLDLPAEEPGDAPEDRYRRAARTLAAWRSDGTLHKDPRPAVYVYEQVYRLPGAQDERTQRGFFARLRLEPFGPGSGVLPHERTMSGPKEDRYRLLRATGVNTSPVIGLYADGPGAASAVLDSVTAGQPLVDVRDDDGVRHRLWSIQDEGLPEGQAAILARAAGDGPITIADGHHRYETAIRYRDERRMSRSCEEDPAFDYLLMLFLETSEPLTVLPTHRIVLGLGDAGVATLRAGLRDLFTVRPVGSAAELAAVFATPRPEAGGSGRFGLWTREGGGILEARREAFAPHLPAGGAALRALDVTLLGVALERLCGIDPAAVAAGGRISYTKSADEALRQVELGERGADAAMLLEPTPVASIAAVAAEGDVMPQKSTYFYPKPLTGLVINPHEW